MRLADFLNRFRQSFRRGDVVRRVGVENEPVALRRKPRDHAGQNGAAADLAHRLVTAAHPPRQPARQQDAGYPRRRSTIDLRHLLTGMTLPVGRYKARIEAPLSKT